MSSETDQATAQGSIPPPVTSSDAPEPAKAPEEAQGIKPTEEKPADDNVKFAKDDNPVDSALPVGVAGTGTDKQEDIAPKEQQPASTETAPAANSADTTVPVGTTDGGEKQEDIAPKTDMGPTMAGALSDNGPPAGVAGAADTADVVAAPAEGEATNGAEKDTSMPDVAEPVNAAVPAAGEKRKAEEEALPTNGDAKKVKADENGTAAAPADTNGKTEPAKKAGRPSKKDKKPLEKAKEVVGRTLRKTRSQGPIDQ